ncbi:MAG: hypothetical protein LBI74_10645 [Synergistaceae bacterium]|nr:hypothetical protein [Synergistaceae bacterium]
MREKTKEKIKSPSENYASTLSIVLFAPRMFSENTTRTERHGSTWKPKDRLFATSAVPNPILWYASRPRAIKNNSSDESNHR